MKQFLLQALACAAVFLPFDRTEAATYGDFKVGQAFTLKVIKVKSVKKVGYFGTESNSPIPASVPKYAKNQKINFKIGSAGKLTANGGLSIPFAHASKSANEYNFFSQGAVSVNHNAEITKSPSRKPIGGTLSYFITKSGGLEPVFYTVTYTLD